MHLSPPLRRVVLAALLLATSGCGSASSPARSSSAFTHEATTPQALAAARSTAPAAPAAWSSGQTLPDAVSEVGVAVLDGQVHVLGGYTHGRAHSRTHLIYDTVKQAWRRGAPLPAALDHIAVAAVGSGATGRVLAIGGYGTAGRPTSATYSYDPVRDAWQTRAPLPRARAAAVTVVVAGSVHVIGGRGPGGDTGEHDVYDPRADRWSVAAAMPTPRDHAAAALLGSTVYVAGGRPGGKTTLEAYDTASDRWRTGLPGLPEGRSSVGGAAWRGAFVVVGGEDATERTAFRTVDAYDPTRRSWRRLPDLPQARQGIGAVVVGGALLIPGGAPTAGGAVQTDQMLVLS